MPVNYEQLARQISSIGDSLAQQRSRIAAETTAYMDQYRANDSRADLLETLQNKISRLKNVRCALPRDVRILTTIPLPENQPAEVEILAADGSQITPNRHHELSYGLVNSAVFMMRPGSGQPPLIVTETQLLEKIAREDLDQSVEEAVAMQRDLAERALLARQASALKTGNPIIALTDGPLEPFYQRKPSSENVRQTSEIHSYFLKMAAYGVLPAGYIDRPRSDLVIRMLNLLNDQLTRENMLKPRELPICDAILFEKFLPADHRSAVFRLVSPSVYSMPEEIRLSFFYLNIGTPTRPGIVRVEIPEWVAAHKPSIDLLHAQLIAQCRILPADPYPYALHRAHEAAVVTAEERDRVTALLIDDLLNRGSAVSPRSNKQTAKDRANHRYNHFNS